MDDNWIISESGKADKSKGFLILENPETKKYLDELLIEKYWPIIRQKLIETDYNFQPIGVPETEFKLEYTHTRSLWFMLFDEMKAFFRGRLNCSLDSWFIESDYFLGLLKNNDPKIIFDILGNSRYRGNPPELKIYKDNDEYFQITFRVGSGESWTENSDQKIISRISEIIEVNTELYDFAIDGFITAEDVGEFLTLVNKVYEAY